jgi:predicted nuclease of predicted toxin-antitoxin system
MSAFLVDECVSSRTVQLIKSLGFPVESLQELGKYGIKDKDVLRLALERKCTLVTYDRGFGDITGHRPYPHSGIIIIRAHDSKSLERCHQVLEKLLKTETEFGETLFIVDRNKYRRRGK